MPNELDVRISAGTLAYSQVFAATIDLHKIHKETRLKRGQEAPYLSPATGLQY